MRFNTNWWSWNSNCREGVRLPKGLLGRLNHLKAGKSETIFRPDSGESR